MPVEGKRQLCGEYGILFGTVLKKTDGSGLQFVMCCSTCREYFMKKAEKKE